MRASWYAKALFELGAKGGISEEKLVSQFVGTISANGDTHMLPKILRAYERSVQLQKKHETISVTTATEVAEGDVLATLRKEPFSNILSGTHKHIIRTVDPTLIGGMVVKTSETRIDVSHKNMLVQIYQNMTSKL